MKSQNAPVRLFNDYPGWETEWSCMGLVLEKAAPCPHSQPPRSVSLAPLSHLTPGQTCVITSFYLHLFEEVSFSGARSRCLKAVLANGAGNENNTNSPSNWRRKRGAGRFSG